MKTILEIECTFKKEEEMENGNYRIKWKDDYQEINTNTFIFSILKEDEWTNLSEILDFTQFKTIRLKIKQTNE